MSVADVVDGAIRELGDFDLIVDESERPETSTYLRRHRHEYVRTVADVVRHKPDAKNTRVMEIGAFFGTVCLSLAELGYQVTATDIPEYMDLPAQVQRYAKHGIATKGVRLQDYVLPFEDESFDVVIMCEVLEHLNFNPIPLLKEINRVLSKGGILYLSLPNYAQIRNRLKVLKGGASGISVKSFFEQVRPGSQAIVYGHWREYTGPEIKQMLVPLGFRIAEQYYFSLAETKRGGGPKKWLGRAFYRKFPIFKENQTTVAVKEERTSLPMNIPETVHSTLRSV